MPETWQCAKGHLLVVSAQRTAGYFWGIQQGKALYFCRAPIL
jgi:hypothetical protein